MLNNPRSTYFQRCLRIRNLTFNFQQKGIKNNIEGKTLATATNSGEVRATLTFKAVQLPPQIRERITIRINDLVDSFNVFHIIYCLITIINKIC